MPAYAATQSAESAGIATQAVQMAAYKERFSDASVVVTPLSLKESGTIATLTYRQETTLTYEKIVGDEPDKSSDSVQRTATLTQTAGGWKVLGIQHVTGPNASLLDAPPVAAKQSSASPVPTARSVRGQQAASTSGGEQRVTPARLKEAVGSRTAMTLSAQVATTSYNYSAMIAYATSHWNSGDSRFPIFSEDCANFTSRALWSGGWAMDGTWYNRWHVDPRFGTKTAEWGKAFTVSADWFTYARNTSHRVSALSSVWQAGNADVLQADWAQPQPDGHIDHTMFVTQISTSDIFITEHTNNALNKSLHLILSQNPGSTWYASRT